MDVLLPIFQLLYFVVHFLYSLGQAVIDCFFELYYMVCSVLWWRKHYNPGCKQIAQDVLLLKKLPRHLVFIFINKNFISYNHILHILEWSACVGIPRVSFYDSEGVLKVRLPSILDGISRIPCNISVSVFIDGQMFVRTGKLSREHGSNIESLKVSRTRLRSDNSFPNKSSHVLNVNLFSMEDSKSDIVHVTKSLCDNSNIKVDVDFLNNHFLNIGHSDADLIVTIGRPICSMGFFPWQIRLTEFLNIPSLSRLDYLKFINLLKQFSRCEQRFGY